MWSIVVSHQKLTRTNREQSSKLILLQLYEKLLKSSMSTILQLFGIWSKLEKWKSYISWLKIKKSLFLKCHLLTFFYTTTRNHFLIWLWHVMKSGFCMTTGQWPAQWLDGEVTKYFPKPNLYQKKVMVTVWWLAASLIQIVFYDNAWPHVVQPML